MRVIEVGPIDAAAPPPRRLTHGPDDGSPRWSPDGRHLAFVREHHGCRSIFVAPLEGGEPFRVSDEGVGATNPSWSPDGKRLAYTVTPLGTPDPDAAPSDAASPQAALSHAHHDNESSSRGGAAGDSLRATRPRVVRGVGERLDGQGWRPPQACIVVTDIETCEHQHVTKGEFADDQVCWSPSGALLGFTSDREPERNDRVFRSDLWIVPASGGEPQRLTRGLGAVRFPAFSSDGRWIAHVGGEDGDAFWDKPSRLMLAVVDGSTAPRPLAPDLTEESVATFPPCPRLHGRPTVPRSFSWASMPAASASTGSMCSPRS